jgi:hypothetical protein
MFMRRKSSIAALALSGAVGFIFSMSAAFATDEAPAPRFASPGTVTWDFVAVGAVGETKNIVIGNSGDAPMVIKEVTVRNPFEFKLVGDTCTGKTLKPGATCVESVQFKPTQAGTRIGGLRFADNTPCASWVTLAGSGTTPPVTARASACTSTEIRPGDPMTVTQTKTVIEGTTTTQGGTTKPPAKPITAASTISFPTSCVSKRKVKVKLTAPSGQTFERVTMSIGKKVVKTLKGKKASTLVSLHGLPRGRFALKVDARLSGGKTFTRTKHYVTCVAKKK